MIWRQYLEGGALMHRRRLIGLGLSAGVASALPAGAAAPSGSADPQAFDRLLARHVRAGRDGVNRVDYRTWRASAADLAGLAAYVEALQAVGSKGRSRPEQIAYWSNLYNAETLRVVLDAYPVKSILAIRPTLISFGPWKAKTLRVDGRRLSLHEVEHEILRPMGDPMIHYALNCASISCPNLPLRAWRGATLAADLDQAARAYVNHPRAVKVTAKGLILSSIYKWYREDFGADDAAVLSHLDRYAAPSLRGVLARRPTIAGYAYDWDLNAVV
jgi:hypothetical protein